MSIYWAIGFGIYIGLAALRWRDMAKADAVSLLRGLLGIPLWPIALIVVAFYQEEE